jgi:hypothetical protein
VPGCGAKAVWFEDNSNRKRLVRRLPLLYPRVRNAGKKERDVKSNKRNKKEQPGDVLGVSNTGPGPQLPSPPSDGSTARGIDVRGDRKRHWGNEDIPQSDGVAGIDMGGGGDGPQIAAEHPRPKVDDDI